MNILDLVPVPSGRWLAGAVLSVLLHPSAVLAQAEIGVDALPAPEPQAAARRLSDRAVPPAPGLTRTAKYQLALTSTLYDAIGRYTQGPAFRPVRFYAEEMPSVTEVLRANIRPLKSLSREARFPSVHYLANRGGTLRQTLPSQSLQGRSDS
jgi:hypothetical protein